MTTAELLAQISDVVLTGGRRTTAVNLRSLISNTVNSFANVDDGGAVFKKEVGYNTEIALLDPKSFVYKKWVQDQIAAIANPISGLTPGFLSKSLTDSTIGNSRFFESDTLTSLTGPQTITDGGSIQMTPTQIIINFTDFYISSANIVPGRVAVMDPYGRLATALTSINEVNSLVNISGNVQTLFDITNASIATLDSNVIHKTGNETKSGVLTFVSSPIGPSPLFPNELTTKGYVDNLLTGLSWKNQVTAKTTADIELTGSQTIDDIAITNQDVLVASQYDPSENGIYTANPSGAWIRRADVDTGSEIYKSTVLVSSGTAHGLTQWTNNNSSVPTLGTTPITYVKISGAGTYSNGAGISLSGNTFYIAANAIVNSMINSMDAAKLTSVVTYDHGGIGLSSYSNGDMLYFNGGVFNKLAIGANGKYISSNGTIPVWADVFQNPMTGIGDFIMGGASGAPTRLASAALYNVMLSGGIGSAASWGKVNLTQHVTGVTPPENGGTGTNVRFKPGTIPFASSAGILKEDNVNLWYDEYFKALNLQALVIAPQSGNTGNYIYTIDSLALDIVSGGGGINVNNSDTGSFGINVVSLGLGLSVDSKDIAGYFTSDLSSAGFFSQIGLLTATNTTPVLAINRNYTLHTFDATEAMLLINNATAASGDLFKAVNLGIDRFRIKPNGETFYYRQSDIAIAVAGSYGQVLTNVSNVGVTPVDLFSRVIKALSHGANGDRISVEYPIICAADAHTKAFAMYFASENFFNFSAMVDPIALNILVKLRLIRISSTILSFTVEVCQSQTGDYVIQLLLKNGTITTDLTVDNTLRLNVTCGAGSGNGIVTSQPAKYLFDPANA